MQDQCQHLLGEMLTKIIFILLSRGNGNEIDYSWTFKELDAQVVEKVTGTLKDAFLLTLPA